MSATFEMHSLLERAGFRIRGKRADCIHCEGSSRLTVSFNAEVAHCHRCKWSANVTILARELGLLDGDRKLRAEFRKRVEAHRKIREEEERFDQWREGHIRKLSAEYRQLWRKAELAQDVLAKYADCEPAWDAFARWCHAEAGLSQALDYLNFAKKKCPQSVDLLTPI